MKTMLGPRYDDQVAAENRFLPSMLSNLLKNLKVSDSVNIAHHSEILSRKASMSLCLLSVFGKCR